MNFNLPSIGYQIVLKEDWCFPLFFERRNSTLLKRVNPDLEISWRADANQSIGCALPAGTILTVDRIYIRKGKSEWDSVTFWVKGPVPGDENRPQNQKLKGARFWAKLEHVNEIEYEPL